MVYFIIFFSGLMIGSFLNVCIYRMPRDESIVFPGSRCTKCKKPLPWYDNIPLFSFLFLIGKCRYCKEKIAFRYFIVELLSAVLFLILYHYFGFTAKFWIYSLITFSLVVATFIDLEFQIIPDRISLGGLVLGILLSIFIPSLHDALTWKVALIRSLFGVLAGAGLIYLTGVLGTIAFKKESMGMGDVKLMGMLGAFLGWKFAILIFFLAPFFGSPAGVYLKFFKKCDIIPYGPYLSLAAFVVMIWGQKILNILFL